LKRVWEREVSEVLGLLLKLVAWGRYEKSPVVEPKVKGVEPEAKEAESILKKVRSAMA
jgi:hypothetical protein